MDEKDSGQQSKKELRILLISISVGVALIKMIWDGQTLPSRKDCKLSKSRPRLSPTGIIKETGTLLATFK